VTALALAGAATGLYGQSPSTTPAPSDDVRASAYYHATLGHLYAELAAQYGGRGEYLSKAIDNYKLAMKEDPGTAYLPGELADLYLQSGQVRTAISEFEEALKKNPDDLNVRRLLARFYTARISQGQQQRLNGEMLNAAIEQYGEIAKRAPEDGANWVMLGRLQKAASHSVEAEKAFQKALDLDASNEDALTGLAMVYSDQGQNDKASVLLRRLADKSPNVRTLTALASVYEQIKDYKGAAEAYRRALELNHDNTELQHAYAQALFESEDFDGALKNFEELLAEDGSDVLATLRISQIYRQKHDFAKAHEYAAKAVELDPNSLEARYNEAWLLESEGKINESIKYLKGILAGMPKKPASFGDRANRVYLLERLGLLYRNTDQTEAAVASFREIIELDPDAGAKAAAEIVQCYLEGKDYANAEREAKAAAARYPADRLVKVMLSTVQADLAHFKEAETTLKSLLDGKGDREIWIALAQNYGKSKSWESMEQAIAQADKLSASDDERESVLFLRGAMFERMKKYDDAEREFRKVLGVNPNSPSTLNYLGYMLADRNVRLNEALEMIRKAVDLEPTNSAFLDSLGWAYFRLNRLDEAEENLRKSLEYGSHDAAVYDHLGDVCSSRNKLKDAIKQWERSLKEWQTTAPGDTEPDEVAKVQKKLEKARVRLAQEHGAGKTQE
jgi:tetratricopeptide (TPR) repeat protein